LCIIISELENYFTLDMIENEKTKFLMPVTVKT
jgi:hypothetical protein